MVPSHLKKLKHDVIELFNYGVNWVNAQNLLLRRLKLDNITLSVSDIYNKIKLYNLEKYRNIYVVGAGKSSTQMACAVEKILSSQIKSGIVATKYGFSIPLKNIKIVESGHPLPDSNSLNAAKQILDVTAQADKNDLVIVLLSGGGSSLMALPNVGITLEDKIRITRELLKHGADISELNYIRKSLSAIKGGKLAGSAYPADVLTLIISDVIGDSLDTIASGPTTHFTPNLEIIKETLMKYGIDKAEQEKLLLNWDDVIQQVKPEIFNNTGNIILANNDTALNAIGAKAVELGYKPVILEEKITNDVEIAAKNYMRIIENKLASKGVKSGLCILSGGETTVNVRGTGNGGRNLEFAMRLVDDLAGMHNALLLSAGSDGDDGNSGIAGGIVHSETRNNMHKNGINYDALLENNDSLRFFESLEDTVITGRTGTNVADIQILLLN